MVHVRSARLVEPGGTVWELSDRPVAGEVERVVEDVAGWYGGSGVRAEVTARVGHGDFPSRGWRESRVMTLHGASICRDSDARDAEERRLSGILWDGQYGELTCDDGDAVLSTGVRLDGEPQIVKTGTTALRYQVPLRAETPFLYGPERTVFVHPVGTSVGLRFPLFVPGCLDFGDAIDTDAPVTNQGNAVAHPVVLVSGDFPGGFRLTVDGRTVEWPWPTVLAAPVEIRSSGSVWIGDANVTAQASVREWWSIPPGGTVSPVLSALQGGSGWAEVHHRDTYI